MDRAQRRRLRKRGVGLATVGLSVALFVGFCLELLGLADVSALEWLLLIAVTLSVQGVMWLVLDRDWDDLIPWDPHFLYVPMLATALLLSFYTMVVPEIRSFTLMMWLVVLVFATGYVGFVEVVALSTLMCAGYVGAVAIGFSRGAPGSMALETAVAGVFLVICTYSGAVFERFKRWRAETLALRRSLAELALTDPLTGLPNRRQFEEAVRNELARIRRHGGRCAVAMIDVDNFKVYNDLLGHPAGDAVLKDLAQVMRSHLRTGDVGARYGGDEFALLMTDTSRGDGSQAVERLRALVEEQQFHRRDIQPHGRITISVGVAACPDDALDYETLLQCADTALYTAKSQGRNRVAATV